MSDHEVTFQHHGSGHHYVTARQERGESSGTYTTGHNAVSRRCAFAFSLFFNIYSRPKSHKQTFIEIFRKARKQALNAPLLIVGDFNARHPSWGYPQEDIKGRKLYDLMALEGITLLTEPAYPTRTGNSVSRDTCPDLTMGINLPQPRWWNSQENLGSDHFIIHTSLSYGRHKKNQKTVKLIDWAAFRKTENFPFHQTPKSYSEWAGTLLQLKNEVTKIIATTPEAPAIDTHLLHLWDARRQLTRRWKRQRLNRQLKTRIAALTAKAEQYAIALAKENWFSKCDSLTGSLHTKSAWHLLRHLIDPDSTRGATRRSLQRVIHGFPGDNANLLRALQSKYVNTARDHIPIPLYDGPDNPELSKAFTVVEVKAAIQNMRKGTAPGPDQVSIGLLSNLSDDMTVASR